ncbi:TPA: hypothetical protein ACU18R_002428 [Mannheimia haemolytica]
MITDKFIIRKADNILLKNEIAIFHPMYFKPSKNISAISIENTKIQKYKNTKIQKYKNTKIQKYKNTKIQKYKYYPRIDINY